MSWKSEVASQGSWIANRLRFKDYVEAEAYATDFKNRCNWVTDTRVVSCAELATHRYINGELLLKIELHKPSASIEG